jgi:hypothetical protein
MKGRRGRYGHFNLRSRGMKVVDTWDQPTKGKGGWALTRKTSRAEGRPNADEAI